MPGTEAGVTTAELVVLMGFLTSGLLVGVIGQWLDQLVAYIKGK